MGERKIDETATLRHAPSTGAKFVVSAKCHLAALSDEFLVTKGKMIAAIGKNKVATICVASYHFYFC